MNRRPIDSVRENALALPELERAELARELVASLDGPADLDAEADWDTEVCRRINEIEAGHATLLDPEDVLARVRTRIGAS